MELYRYGGNFSDIEITSESSEIQTSRMDTAKVDWYALNKLGCLINGGLKSVSDIYAIEQALRAIVFHDNIHEVKPSYKIQIISPGYTPSVFNQAPESEYGSELQEILTISNNHVFLHGVDQLIGFSENVDVHLWLSQRDEIRLRKIEAEREKWQKLGLPEPTFSIDFETLPIDFIAPNKEYYFDKIFSDDESYFKRFLKPLAASGHAVYFGSPFLRERYDRLHNNNASNFFSSMDKGYDDYFMSMKRLLRIPIPPMLNIILSRSGSRGDIPSEIICLKEEFKGARFGLWELFEELNRIDGLDACNRIILDVEKHAASIIPDSLQRYSPSNVFNFDFAKRLKELSFTDLFLGFGSIPKELLTQSIKVDAATKISESIDLRNTTKHLVRLLSEPEIQSIADSIDWPN